MQIAIQLVGLGIVRDQQVGPTIVLVVQKGDAERFGTGIENAAGRSGVFEGPCGGIVEEAASFAAVRFGGAVGFLFAVEAAEDVMLRRPLHVIADEQIENN